MEDGATIAVLDHVRGDNRSRIVGLAEPDVVRLVEVRERKNLLTGELRPVVDRYEVDFELPELPGTGSRPDHLLLSGVGDSLYAIWRDGTLVRLDIREPAEARVAQILDVVPDEGAELTALRFLPGRGTLMTGDSTGAVRGWFTTRPPHGGTVDGLVLVNAYDLGQTDAAVRAFAPSVRSRMLLVSYADGTSRLFHATTTDLLVQTELAGRQPLAAAVFPKDDGFAVLTAGSMASWALDPAHPEASVTALFEEVWYEGYPAPAHVWQSSAGSDAFEPKLGMMPLIFGTVKANGVLDALRRPARAPRRRVHERVPRATPARARQVRHRDDGQLAERRARFPGRARPRALRTDRPCRPRLRRS